jgi:hypothetical protein
LAAPDIDLDVFKSQMRRFLRLNDDRKRSQMSVAHRSIVARVSKVETSIVTVQEDISEMRPVTDDVKRWKLVGLGALGAIEIGGMTMGVTFADAIRRIGAGILGGDFACGDLTKYRVGLLTDLAGEAFVSR